MLAQGIIEFVPMKFSEHYYAILNLHLQSVLIDYRFRTKPIFESVPPMTTNRKQPGSEEQKSATTNKDVQLGAGLPF